MTYREKLASLLADPQPSDESIRDFCQQAADFAVTQKGRDPRIRLGAGYLAKSWLANRPHMQNKVSVDIKELIHRLEDLAKAADLPNIMC